MKVDDNWITKYLKRLEIDVNPNMELPFLTLLQNQHMLMIPFENLDVINKKHIELKSDLLVKKILNYQRGGFCFELNGAFHFLLSQLGFKVRMIEASVYNNDTQEFGNMRNHMTLIITLDQDYRTLMP